MARIDLVSAQAFVTGASGGLGEVIARRLASDGATVTVTARRADRLEALARDIRGRALPCDLADRDSLGRLLEAAEEADVLVANAALPASGPLDDFSVEEIDRALDVNLRAPILLARAAGTAMSRRGRGHIVFVSSMAAKTAGPSLGLYAATKAGLRALALTIREDLRASGVGVSVILPGPISETGMWADGGIPTPRGIRLKPPTAVADAVVRSIRDNRAEIDVATLPLRAAASLAQLAPAIFAALSRRDAGHHASALTQVGRRHR